MSEKPKRSARQGAAYEVGYCRPPKGTQFKPGQSGNPRGRRPGQRNMRTVFMDALNEQVTITENGSKRKISKMDAIIQIAINKALKGDHKSLAATIQLARSTGLLDEETNVSATDSVSATDQAILDAYLERQGISPQKSCERSQANALDEDASEDNVADAVERQAAGDQP